MLVRLIYASRALEQGADSLQQILTRSQAYNPEHGITGVLCGCGHYFMQVLEGGAAAVNPLYLRIAADPRHQDVSLLAYDQIGERRFGAWTMGHVNMRKVNTNVILKYSATAQLDPYRLSGAMALALLEELSSTAAIGKQ